uniref:DM2 domain-containing protein n=1 Tax=viral metagenome TaxID=1070528 RepID=A0A6C0HU85_9ZZZZ
MSFDQLDEYVKNDKLDGYVKQVKISEELADFLGKPYGTKMSRTQVTIDIFDYSKKNCVLYKRVIYVDEKPRLLFNVQAVSFHNFQKTLSPHFQ